MQFKMMFWNVPLTSCRINANKCRFLLLSASSKHTAEARTLLEFDKCIYLNDFPRELGESWSSFISYWRESSIVFCVITCKHHLSAPHPNLQLYNFFSPWLLSWFLKCNFNKWYARIKVFVHKVIRERMDSTIKHRQKKKFLKTAFTAWRGWRIVHIASPPTRIKWKRESWELLHFHDVLH